LNHPHLAEQFPSDALFTSRENLQILIFSGSSELCKISDQIIKNRVNQISFPSAKEQV
jgi:hypothetical protein